MTNINKKVWQYIDNRIEIKKTLLTDLINTSALARKIGKDLSMEGNLDAIISAIRRYKGKVSGHDDYKRFYELLKKAKISTKTKLASIVISRNDETSKKAIGLYSKLKINRDSTFRIFEVTNYIKIIMDDYLLKELKKMFSDSEIETTETNLGELTINYRDDITKIPGIFATLSNELSINEVSIIDSMICQNEHIVIVKENDLEKAFTIIFNLTR